MKAERLFKDVLKWLLHPEGEAVERDSNKVVAVSLKLADIYAGWGMEKEGGGQKEHLERAVQGYQFCVDTTQEKVEKGEKEGGMLESSIWEVKGRNSLAHRLYTVE